MESEKEPKPETESAKKEGPELIDVSVESDDDPSTRTPESPREGGAPEGDRSLGMLCHLLGFVGFIGIPLGNVLGPLVLWLVKKDSDAFVAETGRNVLNFQISASIYGLICGLLMFVFIGVILLPILLIAVIVLTIIGALKANEGILYEYPYTIRFLK
jgi:uncharacterized Tic20 family protein